MKSFRDILNLMAAEMNKTLYIIAGANGSGKTTFAMTYSILKSLYFINADEIAKQYGPTDLQKYKIKAGKEFFKQLEQYMMSIMKNHLL